MLSSVVICAKGRGCRGADAGQDLNGQKAVGSWSAGCASVCFLTTEKFSMVSPEQPTLQDEHIGKANLFNVCHLRMVKPEVSLVDHQNVHHLSQQTRHHQSPRKQKWWRLGVPWSVSQRQPRPGLNRPKPGAAESHPRLMSANRHPMQ